MTTIGSVNRKTRDNALRKLSKEIDFCWMDMTTEDITVIEKLFEDETFPQQELAASVASKFYYHMEQYEDAVEFALYSGSHFDVGEENSEYVNTVVAKCIDAYVAKRQKKEVDEPTSAQESWGIEWGFSQGDREHSLHMVIPKSDAWKVANEHDTFRMQFDAFRMHFNAF